VRSTSSLYALVLTPTSVQIRKGVAGSTSVVRMTLIITDLPAKLHLTAAPRTDLFVDPGGSAPTLNARWPSPW
jgi:hypothetical protein